MPKGVCELFEMARIVSAVRESISKPQVIFEPTETLSAIPLDGGPKGWHASQDSKSSIVTRFFAAMHTALRLEGAGEKHTSVDENDSPL